MGTAYAVEDNVHAVTGKAVNFLYEVLLPVINRDSAHVKYGQRPLR